MKRLFFAAVLGVLASHASAADLPVPGPVPPPNYVPTTAPLPFSWTGVYLGVNGGFGLGNSSWTHTPPPPATAVSTGNFTADGALVGGTIGVNYDLEALVLGLEGDADWSNVHGTSSAPTCAAAGSTTGAGCETKSNWLATLRPRVGYSFNRVLVYATGGIAFTDVLAGQNPPGTFDSTFKVGWTFGGGVEGAITPNWTAKVEYLYVNLGSGTCTTGANCGGTAVSNVALSENIIRAGVNYKFGW